MRRSNITSVSALIVLVVTPAYAQQDVPNSMASHTLFVILITGAFLVWAASYSVHFYRDREDQREHQRESLESHRDTLFDEIAELETAYETGAISESRYKTRLKSLRSDLARTLGGLRTFESPPDRPTRAGRKRV